jgi:hypothetical protein
LVDSISEATEEIPREVVFIESGELEVLSDEKIMRTLRRGDVIGKQWLILGNDSVGSSNAGHRTSIRATAPVTLLSGLTKLDFIEDLRQIFPADFLGYHRECLNAWGAEILLEPSVYLRCWIYQYCQHRSLK